MKTTIIAIVGKSGSGKTTITKLASLALGVKSVVSYTTRPKREEEVNGIDHWFVDESAMPEKECMLAYTLYGGYHYWVTHDQLVPGEVYTYVINEDALVEMIDKFAYKYNFFAIYVDRSNIDVSEDRTIRDKDRKELDKSYYNYVVVNDGTFEKFADDSLRYINFVLEILENSEID